MAAQPDAGRLTEMIRSLSAASPADLDGLASTLARHCWPSGVGDRSDVIALAWLSRWRPLRLQTPTHDCGCVGGRCVICN